MIWKYLQSVMVGDTFLEEDGNGWRWGCWEIRQDTEMADVLFPDSPIFIMLELKCYKML